MRGQATRPGMHTFRITGAGIEVFPAALVYGDTGEASMTAASERSKIRLSVGVPRLDEMLGGGLPSGYSLLVGQGRPDRARPSLPQPSWPKACTGENRA